MDLTITAESSFAFSIEIDGKRHWLEQRGGEWRLDGQWVASKTINWPEALARALNIATNQPVRFRTWRAIERNNP
jgi:hypothetical protein